MTGADVVAVFLVGVKILLAVLSVIFLVSGLDDFFIDLFHGVRDAYRRRFVLPKHRKLTQEHLMLPTEQPVAVMIPAWDESAVIRQMLTMTMQAVDYGNYHVFVGTYRNDPATQNEVEKVRERFENVHKVVTPHDGPTNKADCLNWIYQGIKLWEKENGVRFEIFVLNDSEDFCHPLYLRLFNYLIPRKDMVQLPVFPLEKPWWDFTAGHYLDEFAENHSKDMLVRESLSGVIPCAGVGCAFSRRALESVVEKNNNVLFNIDSLTEDYDFGFQLRDYGLRQVFVRQAIERTAMRKRAFGRGTRPVTVQEFIAIREYFPSNLRAAIRQKSRWVVGIALQGWQKMGWRGPASIKYMLFRDRKALLTNQVNMLGYVVVFTVLAAWLVNRALPESYRYPPLVESGTALHQLILADTFFLVVRLFQRAYYVKEIYGWGQALLSLPRQAWGNVINFAASVRALRLFARYLVTGKMIAWDKTAHVFPSERELLAFRRKLGDLLLERRFLTVRQLEEALERQKAEGRPLGAVLIDMGLVREDDIVQALGTQLRLSARALDPYATPIELLEMLPRDLAVRHSVFPVELRKNGRLLVAVARPLDADQVRALEVALDRGVELCLSANSDVAFAIQRGYERLQPRAEGAPSLGRVLFDRGIVSGEQLQEALRVQRRSYARLGDVLTSQGVLAEAQLAQVLSRYTPEMGRLGDFLVQEGLITLEQLEGALAEQRKRFRRLGDVMVEQRMVSQDVLDRVLAEAALA